MAKRREKIVAIALDRETQATVGFTKRGLKKAKRRIFKGKKRFTGFTFEKTKKRRR